MNALDQLIVALDFRSQTEALHLVDQLEGSIRWVKVGLELYVAEGRGVVEALRARGLQVFLDLKLHDIPNTVAGAVHSAAATGASLLTVHAAGGPAMISAAVDAAPPAMRLLAVTVLTSMTEDALLAVGIRDRPEQQVVRLGEMAVAAGVHGLVCSSREIIALRSSAAQETRLVVPGIRSANDIQGDQKRTATAAEAMRHGADMLVVGRPITRAADPAAAARSILQEITSAQRA